MQNPYTYVFIRKDIPLAAQLVQSSHATLELGIRLPEHKKPQKVSSLIMLSIKDEEKLLQTKDELDERGIQNYMFYEPDYNMGYTAICTEPIYLDDRRYFKKFQLWK